MQGLADMEGTRNTTISVGATAVEVSPMRSRRVLYIKNTSVGGQIISISLSNTETATAGQGIVLDPKDIFIDSNSEEYICWQGAISAIADGAGGTVAIYERI